MKMSNVELFQKQHLEVFKQLSEITKTKKQMEAEEKKIKAELEKAMDEYDVKSIDNNYIKITRIAESSSKSIDVKALQNEEPKLYGELLEDYPKVTNRKAHVKFTVK